MSESQQKFILDLNGLLDNRVVPYNGNLSQKYDINKLNVMHINLSKCDNIYESGVTNPMHTRSNYDSDSD